MPFSWHLPFKTLSPSESSNILSARSYHRHRRRSDEIRCDGSRSSCFSLRRDLRKFSGDKFISTIRNLESESPRANEGATTTPPLPPHSLSHSPGLARVSACMRACVRVSGRKGRGYRNKHGGRQKGMSIWNDRRRTRWRVILHIGQRKDYHRSAFSQNYNPTLLSIFCLPPLLLRSLTPAFWNALDALPCVPPEDSLILSARESWRVLNGIAIPTRQMCKENRRGSTRYSKLWNVDVSVGHSACDMIYLFVCSFERERRRSLRNWWYCSNLLNQ